MQKNHVTIYYWWLIEINYRSLSSWSLDIDNPLHDHGGVPRHLKPGCVLPDPEAEVTAPGGTLASSEGGQAQLSGPVRGQHSVRRSCYKIY